MIIDQVFFRKKHPSSDSNLRSLVKAISWRIVGSLDTILISYLVVGNLNIALSIGGIEWITKMILYFFHERIWNLLKWGKKENYEY